MVRKSSSGPAAATGAVANATAPIAEAAAHTNDTFMVSPVHRRWTPAENAELTTSCPTAVGLAAGSRKYASARQRACRGADAPA